MSDHEVPDSDGSEEVEAAESRTEPRTELTDDERAQLQELDEKLKQFESQKRWSDVIKTLLAKADIVVELSERISLLSEAGRLYVERSSNQAEAIKCFQQVLDLDPTNVEAIRRLKEMYEKRRDWERLIAVLRLECDQLEPDQQGPRRVEIAQLATERVRKPAVCIELWQQVLESDPDNEEALAALATLYERARDWEPLAEVLSRQSNLVQDSQQLAQLLQKLGMIYADKLKDDDGAVDAFRRLLAIDPDDRRAQEQLKKRYVTLKAWDDLEDFYASLDKWDELIRTLERAADAPGTEKDEKISLLFRVARLWQEKRDKPDRAARAYEKILHADSNNLEAAQELSPIYEKSGDAKKLVGAYEVRLAHAQDPDERVQLLRESGLLYEERLRNPQKAFDCYIEAFKAAPLSEVPREDMERLAPKVRGWDKVFAAYKEAIGSATDPDEALDLRLHFGRALSEQSKLEEAIEQYRAVYDDRPDHAEAIGALEKLYEQTENYTSLLEVLQRRAELEADGEVARQLAYQIAALWDEKLGDADRAIEAYRNILTEYGDEEVEAYRALDFLYEKQDRWDDMAETLERRIELGPGAEELASLKFRLARVLAQHLGDKLRALDLYHEVLTILPEHDGAREALEGMLSDTEVGADAARILEPMYLAAGEWQKQIQALEVLLSANRETEDALDIITKIGELYAEQLQDPKGAFESYCRALAMAPENPGIRARIEGLAHEQNRMADLVAQLEQLARDNPDEAIARSLSMRAAQLHEEQLGDVDSAVAAYMRALERDPTDLEILAALDGLYRRAERWHDLVGVLRKQVEVISEPQRQEELLAQIAFIHDEMLDEPTEAIRVFNEVLELDPANARALGALDQLYERQQMWSELADNVDRQRSLADDDQQRTALMLRLADLRERRMGSVESAIEIYREVLDFDPLNETALGALERIMEGDEHQLLVARILEPLYRDAGEISKLIGVHEIQVRHSESADQRVELLHAMADLYEGSLADLDNAFRCYARALAEDPASVHTQEQLERIAAATGSWQELVRVYEEQVRLVEEPALAVVLHSKTAHVYDESLADAEGAIAHYKHVLELDPADLDAARALERLYQVSERYEELAQIYLAQAAAVEEPRERRDYFFRAASIYEELLQRPNDAIKVYQQALESEPDDIGAIDKLIELYLRMEAWEPLLQVYTRKADVVDDPEEKKRLFAEVGALYERELGDIDKAIDVYRRVLEIDPDDFPAMGRLDALYQATGNWEELLATLEREADLASSEMEALSFRYRVGELWERQLGDGERAADVYRDILTRDPMHEPTLNALERMVAEGNEAVAAARVLEPIYRSAGESARLVNVLEVLIRHEQDPVQAVELLHQVAELYELHLDQPQDAFQALARALAIENDNEQTLGGLERLAEALSAWAEVGRLYDQQVARLREEDPARAADLALRLAMLFEGQGEVAPAIDRYRIVYELEPSNQQAIEALDRLYEASEQWENLAEILVRECEVASPDEVLDLQFRLGEVFETHLDQVDDAIAQYRDILTTNPDHTNAIAALERLFNAGIRPIEVAEVLEPLYRSQGAWDRLVGIQQIELTYQPEVGSRVALMHRLAETAEDRAADQWLAFTWMQRALMENPADEHSISEVERLADATGGWGIAADTYAGILSDSPPPPVALPLGKRLARIYQEQLADVQRAEETYRYVLGTDDTEADALAALDEIYVEHGANEALAEVLKRRAAAAEDEYDRVEFSYRLGQVLAEDLARTDEAVAVYRKILEQLNPEHEDTILALQKCYAQKQDWANLFDVCQRQLDITSGDADQAEILGRMALLAANELGDYDRAVELLKRVLDLNGEDPNALNALGNIYAAQENWADLVDVLEREVAVCDDDQMRIRIHSDLGRIWYDKLQRDRNAIESWERVLDIEPAQVDALFAIANIHRRAEARTDLVDVLHRIIDVGSALLEDSVLEGVYCELGELYTTLEQHGDSVESYNRALELNPRNFAAMDALEALHNEQAEWHDLIRVKELRINALQDVQDKIAVLLSIAKIWEEQLQEPDGAAEPYARVLELDPLHQDAFDKLEGLHKSAERFTELIDLYIGRVEATEDIGERVRLLREVARVNERDLNDRNQAFDALLLAWTQDFKDEECAQELERLTGLTQRWNELLTTANESLQELAPDDNASRIAIYLKCAKWYAREGHPEHAIAYLEQVLAIDTTNVPAMRQMADLYKQTQQWQVYSQILTRISDMTENPDDRADVFVRMGELHEEILGQPAEAIRYYQRAIESAPHFVPALQALERMYRAEEEWGELLEVLRQKVEALAETDEAVAARLELAEAYEDRGNLVERAIEQYSEVLRIDEANIQALKGLERLYVMAERWKDLLDVLERQLELAGSEGDQVTLLCRLASMYEEKFIKPEQAAQRLERVLEIDPAHIEAIIGLARMYRQMQRWDDLIQVYDRHIGATPDREEKVALYHKIGDVCEKELNDKDQAIEAYLNATSIDENDVTALGALSRLYTAQEEHSQALDAMEKLAGLVTEQEQRVDLYYRMARLFHEQMGDAGTALDYLQRGVDIDAGHLPSLELMKVIYVQESDWLAAARTLERAAGVEQNARRGAELQVELGLVYRDKLDEPERAIECFEAAHQLNPDNEEAALPLVDEYTAKERWADAEPLLQMLVRKMGSAEPEEQYRLWFLLGQCADHLEEDEGAIRAYGEASKLAPQDLPALRGLAAAYYRTKNWAEAFRYYQMALVHHRDALSSEETTDTFYRLGVIKAEQNEPRKALNMFDKALAEDSQHRPTVEALIKLYTAENDFEQAIHFKKRLLELAEGDEERFRLLEEIGDLWKSKLNNNVKAIEAYEEASDIEPTNHRILHRLLALYQESRQWEQAIEIISRISDLDDRDSAKAKYAYTVGVIQRDELKDADAAIDSFNRALDLDATGQLKAFEAINRLLTQRKDWKQLERAFRKMLHRMVGQDPSLEFNLWHNLGVIYRDRQKNLESAAEAFKMAAKIEPDNMQEHQILAELYAVMPERLDDAIEEHQLLLKNDPQRVESYRALYKLYFGARAYDKAWCVARSLAFLKKADQEQRQFYEQYLQRGPIRPQSRLTNELWAKEMLHPEEDFLVGKLFEAITPALLRIRGRSDRALKLSKKHLIPDLNNTTVTFARTFGFVAQVMGLPFSPRLFVNPEMPGGLAYAVTQPQPPASVCGGALLSGYAPTDLMFEVARHLTYYRPEHYIRAMFQTKDELKNLLVVSMKIAGVDISTSDVEQLAAEIQGKMLPAELEMLRGIGKRFVSAGARTDIKRWMQTVELTACRAGMLMANDLDIASKMIQALPAQSLVDLPPKDKIMELVLFSVSEQYFRLREALGIRIQVG